MIQRYAQRLRKRSFETVFIMRLIYLPYDLVNYLAGLLRVRYLSFISATVLGSLPGTVSFVLFGASLEHFSLTSLPKFNPWLLVISIALFVASLLLSRWFQRLERPTTHPQKI